MHFYGLSQELRPWAFECPLLKCSNWGVGCVFFCFFEALLWHEALDGTA